MILVLLGNVRAALLVTLTIPLSIALAGLLLQPLGVGLNTMTLGGLAIAVGLLVDAAIIMVENILHRLAGAPTRREQRERRGARRRGRGRAAHRVRDADRDRRVPAAVRDDRYRRAACTSRWRPP